MWSVWSKSLDIYLGHGLAMLKAGSGNAVVLRVPAAFSLDRALSTLIESAAKDIAVGRRIRLYFSGAICPAFSIAAPKEVTRWQERQQIAHAIAAKNQGVHASEINCELDSVHPDIAAAMPIASLEELRRCAHRQGGRIVSMEPLWSAATRCPAARHSTVQSFILLEPDAATMLAYGDKGVFDALTLPGQIDTATLTAHTRRWLVGHGLAEDKAMKIGFGATLGVAMPGSPLPWSGHWYQV